MSPAIAGMLLSQRVMECGLCMVLVDPVWWPWGHRSVDFPCPVIFQFLKCFTDTRNWKLRKSRFFFFFKIREAKKTFFFKFCHAFQKADYGKEGIQTGSYSPAKFADNQTMSLNIRSANSQGFGSDWSEAVTDNANSFNRWNHYERISIFWPLQNDQMMIIRYDMYIINFCDMIQTTRQTEKSNSHVSPIWQFNNLRAPIFFFV